MLSPTPHPRSFYPPRLKPSPCLISRPALHRWGRRSFDACEAPLLGAFLTATPASFSGGLATPTRRPRRSRIHVGFPWIGGTGTPCRGPGGTGSELERGLDRFLLFAAVVVPRMFGFTGACPDWRRLGHLCLFSAAPLQHHLGRAFGGRGCRRG